MELLWLAHQLLHRATGSAAPAGLEESRADELAERLRAFWGDGASAGGGELLILADAAGFLFTTDVSPHLRELPPPPAEPSTFRLGTEDPEDRNRFVQRLARLGQDGELRRRYGELLVDIWESVRPEWESRGLPLVREVCRHVREGIEGGAGVEDAVPAVAEVAAKRSTWAALVSEAIGSGRLAITPGYFGGRWSIWDLPVHLVVGYGVGVGDGLAEIRALATRLAPRLKALGDPTRLAILVSLGARPASIVEVARSFGLAQPTVSAHFHLLRDARLIVGVREDSRTRYRMERGRLADLLGETARSAGLDLGG